MAAEHSLLLKTLREIITMLSDKRLASLIKSKDLEATVKSFCTLVEAYSTSEGLNASNDGADEATKQTLNEINQHLIIFNEHNLIELKKLDFVENIKPQI